MKNIRSITQKPSFWILQVLLCLGCLSLAFHFFPKAFPIIDLKITMDRTEALRRAAELAKREKWGPDHFKQTASFDLDQQTQTFVELAEGGNQAFAEILKSGLYAPYTWRIRHFAEGQTTETEIRFTPTGSFYGFQQKIPENAPGASLSPSEALQLAENFAKEDWHIDFDPYYLVEKSHEIRPNKRIDHTFVYERTREHIGEGKYRLALSVSGNQLTGIQYFIQIPDAFLRRYSEMRSANDTIAILANVGMVIFYLLGGCGLGLFFLARKRWVIWQTPLLMGGIVAGFQFLEQLNQFPLIWMNYDTAVAASGFLIKTLFSALILFLGDWFLLSISFMAAESLSRKAFPHHPQLWMLWKPKQASTLDVLGRTVGGYLTVGVFFFYLVIIYYVGTQYFGWWSPSDILFQPNAFTSYCPWFTSIAMSLHAGFWEESLFRAVPLAGAALIGSRWGNRRIWILAALILQALIFGAAHANYPAQPSYARVVELILPSLLFGGLYLRFGLLPGMILHFTFDVISFAIPVFVASTPYVWVDQFLIVFLALIPLWIVVGSRFKVGSWKQLGIAFFNKSWSPKESQVHQKKLDKVAEHQSLNQQKGKQVIGKELTYGIIGLGVLSLLVWLGVIKFTNEIPSLTVDRDKAIEIARNAFKKEGFQLSPDWRAVAHTLVRSEDEDRFIWETEGQERYYRLIGNYLSTPSWLVRFIRLDVDTDVDVGERAEEFQAFITQNGSVSRLRHQVPEGRNGPILSVDEAKKVALAAVKHLYDLDPDGLKDDSSIASKLPHRKDWLFIFSDLKTQLKSGDARIGVRIAGDQEVASRRFVFAPEEWTRADRDRENSVSIISIFSSLVITVLFLAGIIQSVIQWTKKKFDLNAFQKSLIFFGTLQLIDFANSIPLFYGQLSTTQPFRNQVLTWISLKLIKIFATALSLGLLVGWVHYEAQGQSRVRQKYLSFVGYSLGAVGVVLVGSISHLLPTPLPMFGRFGSLDKYIPILGGIQSIERYAFLTLLFCILTLFVHRITAGWAKQSILGSVILFLIGFCVVGTDPNDFQRWILLGLVTGGYLLVVYRYLLHFDLSLIPLATGILFILTEWKQISLHPYAGSTLHSGFEIILFIVVSLGWHFYLSGLPKVLVGVVRSQSKRR